MAYSIETYTKKRFDEVVALIKNFYAEALKYYDMGFDEEATKRTVENISENNAENAFLLIIDGKCQGILAGIEVPSLHNGKRIFQEIIWYVNKRFRRYGIVLLAKVQDILRGRGFKTIIMAVLEDSKPNKIKALYERMGFRMFETHYIREL